MHNVTTKTLISFVFDFELLLYEFVVFYNGTDFQPEQQILYLSDTFEKKQEEPSNGQWIIVSETEYFQTFYPRIVRR